MQPATPTPQRPYSVSVAGVVVDGAGRVLVIRRRDNGRWEPPGGILEPAETVEDGLVREILEETGIRVGVERLTGVYQHVPARIIALVFRCHPLEGSAGATAEATEARWVDRSSVDALMSPAFAVRIHDAFAGPAPVRAHDGERLY
ncbi:MAG TPA: NUDIX domain-containing protein [Kineosporiaceae bacterium]